MATKRLNVLRDASVSVSLSSLLSREKASEIRRQTVRAPQRGTRNPKRQHFGGSQEREGEEKVEAEEGRAE